MLRVQEVCKEKGINMTILAKKLGVSYQALYAAVSGNPTISKLKEIADALEVEVADLFQREAESGIKCPNCGKHLNIKVE